MKVNRKIIKDILIRDSFCKKESQLKSLKIVLRLKLLNYLDALNVIHKIRKNSSFCKINNRCFITSRSKAVNRKTRLSRIKFKELANNGLLIGFKKHSW